MIEFTETQLLIAVISMVLIQGAAVINGKRYGGTVVSFIVGTGLGYLAFRFALTILPQVM